MKYQVRDIADSIPAFKGQLAKMQQRARDDIADGSDSEIHLHPLVPDMPRGHVPIHRVPVFKVEWQVHQTDDGQYAGIVLWTLLQHEGVFPVTVNEQSPVRMKDAPDFFENIGDCETLAQECEDALRRDIVEWFAEKKE